MEKAESLKKTAISKIPENKVKMEENENLFLKKRSVKCCISSCGSKISPHFSFPRDAKIRKIWEDTTGKSNVKSTQQLKVCFKHFDKDDIARDLKSELLKLPSKPKLKEGAVPKYDLFDAESDPKSTVKVTKRGRVIKARQRLGEFEFITPDDIEKEENPVPKNANNKGIADIKKRIEFLKSELAELRKNREVQAPILEVNEAKNEEVSADDIRQRYRAEVGLRNKLANLTSKLTPSTAKSMHENFHISEENDEKLFYVPLNWLALQGSPQVTAEYFVNQLIDNPLLQISKTKSELLAHLNQSKMSSVYGALPLCFTQLV